MRRAESSSPHVATVHGTVSWDSLEDVGSRTVLGGSIGGGVVEDASSLEGVGSRIVVGGTIAGVAAGDGAGVKAGVNAGVAAGIRAGVIGE